MQARQASYYQRFLDVLLRESGAQRAASSRKAASALQKRLAAEYAQFEQTAAELAAKRRTLATAENPESNDVDTAELNAQLERTVNKAFSVRQTLQKAEAASLRKQLERIEGRIQRREELKEKIINRRIKELLAEGPEDAWEIPISAQRSLSPAAVVDHTRRNVPTARAETASPGALPERLIRATTRLSNAKKRLETVKLIVGHNDRTNSDVAGHQEQIQEAELLLKLVQTEFDSKVSSLGSELDLVNRKLQRAVDAVARIKALAANGYGSQSELSNAQIHLEQVQFDQRRINDELMLYRKAAEALAAYTENKSTFDSGEHEEAVEAPANNESQFRDTDNGSTPDDDASPPELDRID